MPDLHMPIRGCRGSIQPMLHSPGARAPLPASVVPVPHRSRSVGDPEGHSCRDSDAREMGSRRRGCDRPRRYGYRSAVPLTAGAYAFPSRSSTPRRVAEPPVTRTCYPVRVSTVRWRHSHGRPCRIAAGCLPGPSSGGGIMLHSTTERERPRGVPGSHKSFGAGWRYAWCLRPDVEPPNVLLTGGWAQDQVSMPLHSIASFQGIDPGHVPSRARSAPAPRRQAREDAESTGESSGRVRIVSFFL
jgi:hypothetical protein